MATVPNIKGMTQTDAEAAIVAANLTVGTVSASANEFVDFARAHSQSPAAGSTVADATPVDFDTNTGYTVPDVVGQHIDAAKAALKSAKFVAEYSQRKDGPSDQRDYVAEQFPPAGGKYRAGSLVQLVLYEHVPV